MEGRLVHGDPRDAGTGVCRLPVSQWEAASLPSWGAAVIVVLGNNERKDGDESEYDAAVGVSDRPLLLCTGWPAGDPADEDGAAYRASATTCSTTIAADPWVVYLPRSTPGADAVSAAEGLATAVVAAIETMQPVCVRVVGGRMASESGHQQQQQGAAANSVTVRVLSNSNSYRTDDDDEGWAGGGQRTLMRAARRTLLGCAVAPGCIAGVRIRQAGKHYQKCTPVPT